MRKLFISVLMAVMSFSALAHSIDDVTLIVNGMAATKEEATNIALRSAIEQAFGVFVSANTSIVNNELVKDEIATVASGNVKSFKEIESVVLPNNMCAITLEVVVSTQKLVAYAKSKGASCEFAGATLMANRKLTLLNKTNTEKVYENLFQQLEAMAPYIFDHKLILGEPFLLSNQESFIFPFTLEITSNENTENFIDLLYSTLCAVGLPEKDKEAVENILGEKLYALKMRKEYISSENMEHSTQHDIKFYLYTPFDESRLEQLLINEMYYTVLTSNLGTQYEVQYRHGRNGRKKTGDERIRMYTFTESYGIWKEDVIFINLPDFKKQETLPKTKRNPTPQPHEPIVISIVEGSISVPLDEVDQITNFEIKKQQ